jgi:hypothetical protein
LDFDCLIEATDPEYEPDVSSKNKCSQKTKIVEFKVVEKAKTLRRLQSDDDSTDSDDSVEEET